jgi:hypothetical protein
VGARGGWIIPGRLGVDEDEGLQRICVLVCDVFSFFFGGGGRGRARDAERQRFGGSGDDGLMML